MNHRNIPLGYALSGGIIIINEAEADTVREIAEQYLSGKSLKAIAEMLTAKHIEYMSGKTDWNRSRIKRIVEDKRYIGDGGYLPILTEQEFAAMQSIKAEKNTQKDVNHTEGIFTLNAPGTFSQTAKVGYSPLAASLISLMILTASINRPLRVVSSSPFASCFNPARFPATDKSWQGLPKVMMSTGSMSPP